MCPARNALSERALTPFAEYFERGSAIDLLFTDLGLPGRIDGRILSERARDLRPSLRVVITTTYAGTALIHDGRLDAGVELLSKPFSFEALAVRIRQVLDRDSPPGGACFLVVEDETLLRMFVVDTLTEAGCRTEEAGSFSEAMAKMEDIGDQRVHCRSWVAGQTRE